MSSILLYYLLTYISYCTKASFGEEITEAQIKNI